MNSFPLRLFLLGEHIDIESPIDIKQFHTELAEVLSKRANANFDGWWLFKKSDEKLVSINIINIIGIEEL